MSPLLPIEKNDYIRNVIREHGFLPGHFTGASGKREILKIDIPPLMSRETDFYKAVGFALTTIYIRDIEPHRPAHYLGGISEGGSILTAAFNQMMVRRGRRPIPSFNFPKGPNGQPAGETLTGAFPEGSLSRGIILDDVLAHAGSALRCLNTAKAHNIFVEDFITLVLRHKNGPANLAAGGVRTHHYFTVGEVISKPNAEGWKAFYGEYPLGYPPAT